MGDESLDLKKFESLVEQNRIDDALNYLKGFESDSDALCKQGWIMEHCKHDLGAALECYKTSAEMGNSMAMYSAGFVLLNQGNQPAAIKYLESGAELDNPKCLLLLASIYLDEGRDSDTVIRCCRRSAELGEVNAQVLLGTLYADGEIVPHSKEQAAHWFSMAAEAGSSEAQFQLSLIVPDKQEAAVWLERAAGQGHSTALYELAMLRLNEQNGLDEAVRLLTYSCEEGNPVAMFEMFKIFSENKLIKSNDQVAYKWCISAAMLGHVESIFQLGKRLLNTGNEEAAVQWLQKGVEKNHPNAMELLGTFYCKTPATHSKGQALLERAARIRETPSQA